MNYFSRLRMIAAVALAIISLFAVEVSAQQNPRELFQRARMLDESNQNLTEAIKLYNQVINQANDQRALAAKAQLRIALLYERLGRKAEAQRAFQVVVSQYADQAEVARQAGAKLPTVAAPRRNTFASARTATGLTVRQVWTSAAEAGAAAISPDGHYLAYVGPGIALYVRDLLTKDDRRLTTISPWWDMERVIDPAFSPDGKLIAYGLNNRDHTDLVLIPLDGSAARVLYRSDTGEGLGPLGWSSDGKHILAWHGQKGVRQIVLVSVADGSVHVVKTLDSNSSPARLNLSHDGRYIVYDSPAGKDSPERDIFLLSTDDGHEVPLVTQTGDDRYPIWTPDGRGILFLSERAGNPGMWFLRVVDGKPQGSPELVKRDMSKSIQLMGFSRDGSFYYRLQPNQNELYAATLDPTSGKIMSQPAVVTRRLVTGQVSWSPDGLSLAYVSERPSLQGEVGAEIVVIRSLANGEEYELAPALNNFELRPSSWSSDDRSLIVEGKDKLGRYGLYRVDVRTSDIAPLLYGKPGEWFDHPNWFLNGKSIVFIRRSESIVLHDLETGHDTELYRPIAPVLLGSCLEVSRDGQRLAFYLRDPKSQSMSVMVMTAPGEKPRELGSPVKYPEIIDDIWAFTPDGRNVLFSTYDREENTAHRVWQVAIEGGSTHQVQLPMERLGYVGDASFHPDGRQIAFMSKYRKSEVWAMENFLPAAQSRKASASRR